MAKLSSSSSNKHKKEKNKKPRKSSITQTKKGTKSKKTFLYMGVGLWIILLLFLVLIIHLAQKNRTPVHKPGETYERKHLLGLENKIDDVDSLIYHYLLDNDIYSENIIYKVEKRHAHDGTAWNYCKMIIPVPRSVELKPLRSSIKKCLRHINHNVSVILYNTKNTRGFGVKIEIDGCLTHRLIFVQQGKDFFKKYKESRVPHRAKIAIVIDDFGFSFKKAKLFLKIPVPITFSILPFRKHSTEIAKLVHRYHHDIILHLPMQPYGYPTVNPGNNALLLSMTNKQIIENLRKDLDSFDSLIVGVNNHMGSAFTENPDKMKIVLKEIKKRHLFFLDSLTSPHSVAYMMAVSLHIPCGRRNIFLDVKQNKSFIEAQLNKLISIARRNGKAIAIGHPYEITFKILEKELPIINKNKANIVPISQVIN